MKKLIAILLICAALFGMMSCTAEVGNETTKADSQQAPGSEKETATSGAIDKASKSQDDTTTNSATTEPRKVESPFGINMSDLDELMLPIFSSKTIKNETVMFLEKGDVKTLLYPIDTIISVTSYDGSIVYKEGKDYELVDGKLKVLENSSIPCITKAVYYNCSGSKLVTKYNGQFVDTYWGENMMYQWQVNVNYTHSSEWTGFEQESYSDIFESFIDKLMNGEDVTVIFYGDSITNGANSSFIGGYAPNQHSYPMLFTEALADLFGYTVKYVETQSELGNSPKVPTEDYVAGSNGTITYINTAVGGWTSTNGINNVQNYIINYVNTYGCDLLVLAYGMNDGTNPIETKNNVKAIADKTLEVAPNASVALISTMVCNPLDANRPAAAKANQRAAMKALAEEYVSAGVPSAVCDMGSVSLSVLTRKNFHDYSGNNINHPNDFFGRIYAQTLLQTVIGYENMN